MSRTHKRAAKNAAAVTSAIGDDFKAFAVNPAQGFVFNSPIGVWFFVTLLPLLLATSFIGSVMIGLMVWAPVLFASALLGLLTIVWLFSALAWFRLRGWGEAVMSIEHRRRKEHNYGK